MSFYWAATDTFVREENRLVRLIKDLGEHDIRSAKTRRKKQNDKNLFQKNNEILCYLTHNEEAKKTETLIWRNSCFFQCRYQNVCQLPKTIIFLPNYHFFLNKIRPWNNYWEDVGRFFFARISEFNVAMPFWTFELKWLLERNHWTKCWSLRKCQHFCNFFGNSEELICYHFFV